MPRAAADLAKCKSLLIWFVANLWTNVWFAYAMGCGRRSVISLRNMKRFAAVLGDVAVHFVLYHTEAASSRMKKLQPATHVAVHRVYAVGWLLRGGWHLLQGPPGSTDRNVSGGGSSRAEDDALYQTL
ncbi:hypothetical protein Nepgr_021135 [Nepenthes gracilis]|uniref:Uncharacterized protein n=1 Tax=Nepenthes gracilis TaxID=150966 RepID=A0AAD3SZ04_NEPGR|nr:hypothetical protein Nepgr_021135 [Nepenthes gracilis]